jgi:hypothetical protein
MLENEVMSEMPSKPKSTKATKKTAKAAKVKAAPAAATKPVPVEKPKKTPKPKANATQPEEERPKMLNAFFLYQQSLDALKVNPGAIIWLALTPLIASIPIFVLVIFIIFTATATTRGPGTTVGQLPDNSNIAIAIIYLVLLFLTLLVSSAMMHAALKSARSEKISYGKAWSAGWRSYLKFIGLFFLITLVVSIGLVLLIVPGLFLLRRYFLAPYYMIDRNLGILESMEKSAADSKKYGGVWSLLLLFLCIIILAPIPYFGWVASLGLCIMYMCAPAIRYLQITKASGLDPADPSKPLEA